MRKPGVAIGLVINLLAVLSTAAHSMPAPKPIPSTATTFLGPTVTAEVGGQRVILEMPVRSPAGDPMVVVFHALGETASTTAASPAYQPTFRTLLDAGYALVFDDAHFNAWGQADSVTDYGNAYRWAARRLGSTRWYAYAVSMGGIPSQRLIEGGMVPPPRALVLVSAVTRLAAADIVPALQPSLVAAFGGPTAALPSRTAPIDRSLLRVGGLAKVPVLAFSSPEDEIAVKSLNTDILARRLGKDMKVITVSGPHLAQTQFQPDRVLFFFDSH